MYIGKLKAWLVRVALILCLAGVSFQPAAASSEPKKSCVTGKIKTLYYSIFPFRHHTLGLLVIDKDGRKHYVNTVLQPSTNLPQNYGARFIVQVATTAFVTNSTVSIYTINGDCTTVRGRYVTVRLDNVSGIRFAHEVDE